MPTPSLLVPPDFQTFLRPCSAQVFSSGIFLSRDEMNRTLHYLPEHIIGPKDVENKTKCLLHHFPSKVIFLLYDRVLNFSDLAHQHKFHYNACNKGHGQF